MMFKTMILGAVLFCAGVACAEPVQVDNPATPDGGVIKAALTEQWRAGGDDDEIFFGNIANACVDGDGNVLLLDSQLSHVLVISPQGELVRTLGREGDGPGELRRPGDMMLSGDGTLCVLQGFPGHIVKIHPDGTPAGDASYSTGDPNGGQFLVLIRGMAYPDGMALAGIRMSFAGAGKSVQDYFLSICNNQGLQKTQLLTKQHTIDYNDFELSEMGMDFIWRRSATSRDGTVYAAPERNQYQIEAFGKDGQPALIFSRPVTAPDRTTEEKALAHKVLEGVAANYPVPPKRYVIEDKAAVIGGMWATDDGLLWVQASRGVDTPPAGCWAILDVFNAQGKFLRQVAVPGDFNPERDSLDVLSDGRILVTVGALDAFLNQQAVGSDNTDKAAVDPLEVICYDMKLK